METHRGTVMKTTRGTRTDRGSFTRRSFFQGTLIGPLVCSLLGEGTTLRASSRRQQKRYDLLIRGGRVIDPSQDLSAPRDIAVLGHTIATVAADIPEADARHVLDVSGLIVTPGLIDVHVHVFDGVAPLGIPPDPNCVAKGVTTVLDAGSAGAHTFPGFRKYVIEVAQTRIRALLNISVVGQSTLSPDNPHGELLNLNYANPGLAVRTIERHRDLILGIKVRLSRNVAGENDLRALHLAREAAEGVNLPMMVHIGDTHSPLKDLLPVLRAGDVITHCFHGHEGGILDDRGRVLPDVRAAVGRGVHLDVGHGAGSFAFDVAERALKQDMLPGTISSDLHQFNIHGPVFDLATTLSKFLHLGLTLEQVIARVTTHPARTFGFAEGLGTLREGAEADVAVFALREGDFSFVDAMGQRRLGHRKLSPVATVKSGRLYGAATIAVPGSD
jgi:dihydroorotase